MKTFGIIGTAGRKTDFTKLNINMFNWMKQTVLDIILEKRRLTPYQRIKLVSGGAAWADHIAVALFLDNKVNELILYLPCRYNMENHKYETCYYGNVANFYHERFSYKCYGDSSKTLREIHEAYKRGAELDISNRGFFSRNILIARNVDFMIALTFGQKSELKDGGTKHTMAFFLNCNPPQESWHIDLNEKVVYTPATVTESPRDIKNHEI